jgi:hypothetical protein
MSLPADAEDRAWRAFSLTSPDPAPRSAVIGVLDRLCRAATSSLPVDGAVVHLMSSAAGEGVVAASGRTARELGELEFAHGEGPALEATALRRPVLVPDLGVHHASRWPGYTSSARERNVGAVFALPLHRGAVAFGALELYAAAAGPLDAADTGLALAFAGIGTQTLLDNTIVGPDGELEPGLALAMDRRGEIAQAQGMVMVDLRVSLAEALARMRAHAFATEVSLHEMARQVIGGYLLPGAPDALPGPKVEG